jgi:hypothetical protein
MNKIVCFEKSDAKVLEQYNIANLWPTSLNTTMACSMQLIEAHLHVALLIHVRGIGKRAVAGFNWTLLSWIHTRVIINNMMCSAHHFAVVWVEPLLSLPSQSNTSLILRFDMVSYSKSVPRKMYLADGGKKSASDSSNVSATVALKGVWRGQWKYHLPQRQRMLHCQCRSLSGHVVGRSRYHSGWPFK